MHLRVNARPTPAAAAFGMRLDVADAENADGDASDAEFVYDGCYV